MKKLNIDAEHGIDLEKNRDRERSLVPFELIEITC